jgi:tetrahydromethanopterin S-methyltransferase subunit D
LNIAFAPTVVDHGQKAVTTAGTAVALATTTPVPSGLVGIKALAGNTGLIYVGNSDVDSSNGIELSAGELIYWPATDLAHVYIDSAEDGEGVCYVYS